MAWMDRSIEEKACAAVAGAIDRAFARRKGSTVRGVAEPSVTRTAPTRPPAPVTDDSLVALDAARVRELHGLGMATGHDVQRADAAALLAGIIGRQAAAVQRTARTAKPAQLSHAQVEADAETARARLAAGCGKASDVERADALVALKHLMFAGSAA